MTTSCPIESETHRWPECESGEGAAPSPDSTGETYSCEVFFEQCYVDMVKYAQRRIQGKQCAEDIVSDAMYIVVNRWADLKPWINGDGDFLRVRGYAYGIIRNLARDMHRKFDRYLLMTISDVDLRSPSVPDETNYQAMAIDVVRALRELPESQRQVLLMRVRGFTLAEIADELKVTLSSARNQLATARRKIKDILGSAVVGISILTVPTLLAHAPHQEEFPPLDDSCKDGQGISLHLVDLPRQQMTMRIFESRCWLVTPTG